MFKLRTGAFCLALMLSPLVACAAWGQTTSTHVGGNTHVGYKWFKSAQQQLPIVTTKYGSLIRRHAAAYGLPPELLMGVLMTETQGRANVLNGLMQITPSTRQTLRAQGVSCNFKVADCQIEAAAFLLSSLYEKTNNNIDLTIVAYNRGFGGIAKAKLSTDQYLARVRSIVPEVIAVFHPERSFDPHLVLVSNDTDAAQSSQPPSVDAVLQIVGGQ